ncbi:MAG: ribonuclease H [Pseudomonadota bacterium]|nr:ribonuclease H [Pseudomonadota bacterium]
MLGNRIIKTIWTALALIRRDKSLQIFTDGSFKGRWGTWAFVILQDDIVIHEISGRESKTCSNRMEYQAAIEALKILPRGSKANIYSDSRIVVDNITLHAPFWKDNRWLKKNGRPIPNVDQIKILYRLCARHSVKWKWIKAHSGIQYNERCDRLCIKARGSK